MKTVLLWGGPAHQKFVDIDPGLPPIHAVRRNRKITRIGYVNDPLPPVLDFEIDYIEYEPTGIEVWRPRK